MQLGPLSAFVTVDDAPLPEYAVEYSADGLEATCWIPSQTDKSFCIKMNDIDISPKRTVSGRILVDGIACGGKHLTLRGSRISTAQCDSVAISASARKHLTFGTQNLTDDDQYLDTAISPELGTIKVVFNLVKPNAARSTSYTQSKSTVLHERSKKAIGHSVQFGPEFQKNNNITVRSKIIKCLATMVFRYRPIDLLRAEGIVPKERATPTTIDVLDLTMDLDEAETDRAEIKKLEKQLDALKKKSKKSQVKREPFGVKKEVKMEKLIVTPGEIIDLT
ncbi:hypothetical protein K438DRAFT_82076 [Mycena galopus ATCC 62051]|nr:hypothetical protein K438DRAFT_82076 [Mycena galopus ATCC 62051]